MTEADGSAEGDCPAVEKFEPTGLLLGNGVGTLMGWGRIVVTLAGMEARRSVRSGVRVRRRSRVSPENLSQFV